MRPARELLRDYLTRRRAEGPAPASPAVQEENLRRLLRHVGAAHQPSEQLEGQLLAAMRRTARETPPPPALSPFWPQLSPRVWRLAAPAAVCVLLFLVALRPLFNSKGPDPARVVVNPGPRSAPMPVGTSPEDRIPKAERPLIGYVLLPEGDLLRRVPNAREWEPVHGGDPVRLGDAMRTEAGSTGSVVFLDGSDCQLGAGTRLEYGGAHRPGLKRPSRVHLARGQLWVRAEKGGPEFRVVAPAADAVVQGTTFSVTVVDQGATRLQVTEGKVRLQNARSSVLVAAGRESLALVGRSPQPPLPIRHVLKPTPAGESSLPSPTATAGAGAKKPTAPAATSATPGRSSGAIGKPKPSFRIEGDAPRPRPGGKPPQEETDEAPSAPIDSSGSAAGGEAQAPVATGSP